MGLLPGLAGGVACCGAAVFLPAAGEGVLEVSCGGFRDFAGFFSDGGGAIPTSEKASFRLRAKLVCLSALTEGVPHCPATLAGTVPAPDAGG